MRGDGDDGDLPAFGSVAPEDAVRPRRPALRVRLEDLPLRIDRIVERLELVGAEPAVARIVGEIPDCLAHLLEQALLLGRLRSSLTSRGLVRFCACAGGSFSCLLEPLEGLCGLRRPAEPEAHAPSRKLNAAARSGPSPSSPSRACRRPRSTIALAVSLSQSHASRSGTTRQNSTTKVSSACLSCTVRPANARPRVRRPLSSIVFSVDIAFLCRRMGIWAIPTIAHIDAVTPGWRS